MLIAEPVKNEQHAAPHAHGTNFQRAKTTERIDFIKDLVLEVLRLPRTLPAPVFAGPIFQPCGQGSFLEAVLQQMPRTTAGFNFFPRAQTTTIPLADRMNISNRSRMTQPFTATFS